MRLVFHPLRVLRLLLKAEVRMPGSRGGQGFYHPDDGRWRYGERPAVGKHLPEDHGRYFHLPPGTTHVPITQLEALHTKPEKIARAEQHMRNAHEGQGGKRGPLRVTPPNAEGTHAILHGNSTYAVARHHGWSTLPVQITPAVSDQERHDATVRAHMIDCPTCRNRAQIDPLHAQQLAMTKGRLVFKGKLFAPPTPPVGGHRLGKTRGGKDVYLSGAEADDFSDDDHQDAAAIHHRAHRFHATAADEHGKIADTHKAWKVSEEHHGERARHQRLADHHHDVVRDHLLAGGHGGSLELNVLGKTPKVSKVTPHSAKERSEAVKRLKARDRHAHPGNVMKRDRTAYATMGDARS